MQIALAPSTKTAMTIVGISAILGVINFSVFEIPHWINHRSCPGCVNATDKAKAIADSRAAIIQLLVALGTAGTTFFTWRNYVRSTRDAEANLALGIENRISTNFIEAVKQLGHESPAVRAGGVLALGRLLRTATPQGDYWPIMDVLTTFVRDRASNVPGQPRMGKLPKDIQAALNVLARREAESVPGRSGDSPVDIHDTDLTEAWLAGGHLEAAYMGWCRFAQADFTGAKLSHALLFESDLTEANLRGADLTGASLVVADLTRASLDDANLSDANLERAKVAFEQLKMTKGNAKTVLPDGCLRPATWQ